jgi:GNAT superfamily N-acetyltransferase
MREAGMMEADLSELVRLTESQTEPASRTLTQAFHDYPVFTYVFPDACERRNELPLLLQSFLQFGVLNGEVYATSRNLEGVAVWMPPDHTSGSPPVPEVSQDALDRMAYFGGQLYDVRKRHVPSSHWFLMIIGVIPELQGQGYARTLLNPVLARIERQHLPCYLDTEVEKNVAIYQRYGFRVVDDSIVVGTGIRSWGMLRA